ncbi:hypothetical protein N184_23065 [Sinorhizobium sp. GL28]|nr:hypothetical protein N184_23065 [Sinorhizobium sp. GL28]
MIVVTPAYSTNAKLGIEESADRARGGDLALTG